MRIVVVGVCVSGKTTLISRLRELGYEAYGVAQEHSYVPRLWAMGKPDFVVMLDCTYETARKRRAIAWGPERLAEQHKRLSNALGHCDIYVRTDDLTAEEVLSVVVAAISKAIAGKNGGDCGARKSCHAGNGKTAPARGRAHPER